jgi:glycyl-tRNA synthetase alpha chain
MDILTIILRLREFWNKHGIYEIPSYSLPIAAATYHPFCIISCLATKNHNVMYLNACTRYDDGTSFDQQNNAFHRNLQHYQFQVIWREPAKNILELYKQSLEYIGFDFTKHAIKIVDSSWQTTSLGAFGYGYEIYIDDLEITQFTYFDTICDVKLSKPFAEIAYGVERLAIALLNKKPSEIEWCPGIPYSLLRFKEEQHCTLKTKLIAVSDNMPHMLHQITILLNEQLYVAALQDWLKANDHLNELIARNILAVEKRNEYISEMRACAGVIGKHYLNDLIDL